jgi:hypothetical protein
LQERRNAGGGRRAIAKTKIDWVMNRGAQEQFTAREYQAMKPRLEA